MLFLLLFLLFGHLITVTFCLPNVGEFDGGKKTTTAILLTSNAQRGH